MFEDSLLESTGRFKTRRGWTTLLSFVLQAFLLGIMVLIPLIYTEALPKQQLMTFLVAPPPPPPPPPPPAEAPKIEKVKVVQTDIVDGQLRTPTKIPEKVAMIEEEEAPPPMSSVSGVVGGVPGGVPGGQMGGVLGGVLSSTPVAVPKVEQPKKIRVSQGVIQGNAISQPRPIYPPLAKQARIQGAVVLHAVISKNGNIENLEVVSGHPMLVPAAINAVKQWRYKPYYLNGQPVEVETQITVNFSLSGG